LFICYRLHRLELLGKKLKKDLAALDYDKMSLEQLTTISMIILSERLEKVLIKNKAMFTDLQLLRMCHSRVPEFLREIQPKLRVQIEGMKYRPDELIKIIKAYKNIHYYDVSLQDAVFLSLRR